MNQWLLVVQTCMYIRSTRENIFMKLVCVRVGEGASGGVSVRLNMRVGVCERMYVRVRVCVCVRARVCVCARVCACVCMRACVH